MKIDRKALIILAVGFVVILLFWYIALWKPTNSKISTLEATHQGLVTTNKSLVLQRSEVISGTGKLTRSIAQSGVLSTAIPSQVNLPGIINDIDGAMETSGISLSTFTPTLSSASTGTASTASTAAKSVSITLSIFGRYFQIVSFIDQMEQLPRIYTISNISMTTSTLLESQGPDSLFTPNLTVNLTMATYYSGTAEIVVTQPSSGTGTDPTSGGAGTTSGSVPGTTTPSGPSGTSAGTGAGAGAGGTSQVSTPQSTPQNNFTPGASPTSTAVGG